MRLNRPKCAVCGKPFYWYDGWKRDEYCKNGHPPRGARVFSGPPKWMRAALNAAYPDEVRQYFRSGFYMGHRKKLGNRIEAAIFLGHIAQTGSCHSFLDHWGHDPEDNLISEPYAANCPDCLEAAQEFARRIGAVYTVSPVTYHAPWIAECVRMTFAPPRIC